MALRIRRNFHRFASFLSSWESSSMKSTKSFCGSARLEPSLDKNVEETLSKEPMKRRYAFLLGYRGANYYGVCMNPGQDHIPTVGKDLTNALIKTGYADESYLLTAKSSCAASRTDTGVSALRQLIVLDLETEPDLDKIQQYLSEDVKLYGVVRTIKRFVPFRFCDQRSYLYYIPSYAFAPLSLEMNPDYRMTSDVLERVSRLLQKFIGRKNYHNFTRGRTFQDPRAERVIFKAELLEPIEKDGMELACVRLEGASFILNQIRKIIGALVIATRGYAPEKIIDIALSHQGVTLGRSPPDGLMLETLCYDWYNKRFSSNGFDPIDFSNCDEKVEILKDRILKGIVSKEMEYENTKLWVESLQYISFEPYSKEQHALDSSLEYDETLNVVRSEKRPISGREPAALFI